METRAWEVLTDEIPLGRIYFADTVWLCSAHGEQLDIDPISWELGKFRVPLFYLLSWENHLWFLQTKLTLLWWERLSSRVLPLDKFSLIPSSHLIHPFIWQCVTSISGVRGRRRQNGTKPLSKSTVDQRKIFHVVKDTKQKTKISGQLNGKSFRGDIWLYMGGT